MICSETFINDEKHLFHQFVINQPLSVIIMSQCIITKAAPICENRLKLPGSATTASVKNESAPNFIDWKSSLCNTFLL